jgi:hypothetical protein
MANPSRNSEKVQKKRVIDLTCSAVVKIEIMDAMMQGMRTPM